MQMPKNLRPVDANDLDSALAYVRNGGKLVVPTAYRVTVITKRTLASWEKADMWLLKAEGNGYRMRSGRSSVYLLPGQLCYAD